ncbi:hypothetical protein SAMN03159444_04964 [Pseudomonas sp. NFACC02]|nr:hypothetical protein SAMN03159444_04964 [Pseudomonas sp. NFACC02]
MNDDVNFFVIAWRPANTPIRLITADGAPYLTVKWRAPLGAVAYDRPRQLQPVTLPKTVSPTD